MYPATYCRFVADGASFSISTDDPMVTGRTLCDEYELVRDKMGLGWAEMTSAVSPDIFFWLISREHYLTSCWQGIKHKPFNFIVI